MATVTIQEAQATLLELIHQLPPGEEVVITENNQPVAKLARTPADTTVALPGWYCQGENAVFYSLIPSSKDTQATVAQMLPQKFI
jgi:antitoxin (DNA-binding transcriptional repressor) of toxin-antitoxin stability system